jgi:hypothetical protein
MGTSTERREGAGLKAALCTGKPKAALFPTSADHGSLTSKPEGGGIRFAVRERVRVEAVGMLDSAFSGAIGFMWARWGFERR